MAPSNQPLPVRPEQDEPERLDPETERVLTERLADPGPVRPWSEFEAEETQRVPQPPSPR